MRITIRKGKGWMTDNKVTHYEVCRDGHLVESFRYKRQAAKFAKKYKKDRE